MSSNTKTQYFIHNFIHTYIARPLEAFGDWLRAKPRATFKNVQKMAENDEYFDRNNQAFKNWLDRPNKGKIKALHITPTHHSSKQVRVGGKFTK